MAAARSTQRIISGCSHLGISAARCSIRAPHLSRIQPLSLDHAPRWLRRDVARNGLVTRLSGGVRFMGTSSTTGAAHGQSDLSRSSILSQIKASSRRSSFRGGEYGGAPRPSRRSIVLVVSTSSLGLFLLYRHLHPDLSDNIIDTSALIPISTVSNTIVASSPTEHPFSVLSVLRRYLLEPFLTALRFLRLAMIFGPVILTVPIIFFGREIPTGKAGPGGEDMERWGAVWWYGFLVKSMERAGPTFIKLGQWAASRADLFPVSLCSLMGKLHSSAHPHSFHHTKQVLEEVFGKSFNEIFEEFEEKPIGCGAIAQVYRATLRSSLLPPSFFEDRIAMNHANGNESSSKDELNTPVAIKVLHPRIHKTIRRDLAIMSVFAWALNLLPGMEWLSLPEEVQVFGEMMNSQLDLRVEADNLDKFRVNFGKRGPGVSFPKPVKLNGIEKDRETKSGRRIGKAREVLVEEYEDALPLKWFLRNGGGEYDDRIANIGLDAFLNMLLIDNWTHGDLHPGNIMVRFYHPSTKDFLQHLMSSIFSTPEPADPSLSSKSTDIVHRLAAIAHDQTAWLEELDSLAKQGYEPELIFIDAGLVTSLDTTNRRNFLDLFGAVAEFDGYKAGKLMVERCRTPELAIDKETFALKIQHLVLSVKSKTFSLAAIKISDILSDVLTAVRQHHVKMEGDFVNTVISILLLEGIGRQLDPNMDLFKSALPILRQLGRQMGTKEAISQVPVGNIWAMAKIWVWIEAREIAGSSSSASIDEWIKYDRLMQNI